LIEETSPGSLSAGVEQDFQESGVPL